MFSYFAVYAAQAVQRFLHAAHACMPLFVRTLSKFISLTCHVLAGTPSLFFLFSTDCIVLEVYFTCDNQCSNHPATKGPGQPHGSLHATKTRSSS